MDWTKRSRELASSLPDLTLLDLFLFVFVKEIVLKTLFTSLTRLKR